MENVYIISIGDELTKGETANTNAVYISGHLIDRGLNVSSIITLPDNYEIAVDTVERFIHQEGIYIFTGGLGATRDDITRKILGRVLKKRLVTETGSLDRLRMWYTQKGRQFRTADMFQAAYPEGGRLLDNAVGLAYGFYVKAENRRIFSLPGVPGEMTCMFDRQVIPLLEEESVFSSDYRSETILFGDIAEYVLDQKIEKIVSKYSGVRYGTRTQCGVIRVRVESDRVEITPCVDEIVETLKDRFICRGKQDLASLVGEKLLSRSFTLSVAESCTAGYLAKILTDVPGSSRYFIGGIVAYDNAVKGRLLGVSESTLSTYGAVSDQTAREMAFGAQRCFQSDIAVSITGIAGPEGGSTQKPVGTVYICVHEKGGAVTVEKNVFPGDRETVRVRSVNKALFMLFTHLMKGE
jgi:nicotinamide-nucleotide amidase